jgi:hypothetical protein
MSEIRAGLPAGDSSEQRAAEVFVLTQLASDLGVTFEPGQRSMPDGTRVELDAICLNPPMLIEVWAHQGPVLSPADIERLADIAAARLRPAVIAPAPVTSAAKG